MWRATFLLLALGAARALAEHPDGAALPAADADDECGASGEGGCALSALQVRGARLVTDAPVVDGDAEDPDAAAAGGSTVVGDISRKDQAQMLKRLKKHKRKIVKLTKDMNVVEGKVNETYVMTMKELMPSKQDITPPPLPSARGVGAGDDVDASASRRRRRRVKKEKLPPRMKKVDKKITLCDKMIKRIWKRIKRCGDMLVYTRKRIQGGEISYGNSTLANHTATEVEALAQEASAIEDLGSELEEEQEEGEEEETEEDEEVAEGAELEEGAAAEEEEPFEGGEDPHVLMGREDLESRIKQMNTETYDLSRDIAAVGKREEKTRQLFKDTFRTESE